MANRNVIKAAVVFALKGAMENRGAGLSQTTVQKFIARLEGSLAVLVLRKPRVLSSGTSFLTKVEKNFSGACRDSNNWELGLELVILFLM